MPNRSSRLASLSFSLDLRRLSTGALVRPTGSCLSRLASYNPALMIRSWVFFHRSRAGWWLRVESCWFLSESKNQISANRTLTRRRCARGKEPVIRVGSCFIFGIGSDIVKAYVTVGMVVICACCQPITKRCDHGNIQEKTEGLGQERKTAEESRSQN